MNGSAAPRTMDAFYERLRDLGDGLPKRLRQCANYVTANPDRVAVSTVAELAMAAEVQPSAFMRFCQELGFTGFSQMQKLFRDDYSQKWPDYNTRLASLRERGSDTPSALLAEFVEAGRSSLENLTHTANPKAMDKALEILKSANTIHVAGFRRTFPVASYLTYTFEKMSVPAILHSGVGNLDFGHMLREGDALIAITFAPYTTETVQLAEAAESRGLGVVALTDAMTSPLTRIKAAQLLVSEIDVGAFRTLSATMTLAITLAVAVGVSRNLV